jgi:c-di-GMP-binding flagellar brake protein YcgR
MNCAEEHEGPTNRRRYQRYEIDTQLHVTVLGVEQRGAMRGRSLDISEVGIAGVFVTVWDVGSPVHLEFSVPITRSPIRVRGLLRSHSGYRYGFEFVDLNPDQREIISKTCRTLALLQ